MEKTIYIVHDMASWARRPVAAFLTERDARELASHLSPIDGGEGWDDWYDRVGRTISCVPLLEVVRDGDES